MNSEIAMKTIEEAIRGCELTLQASHRQNYLGLEKVISKLKLIRSTLKEGNATIVVSGVAKHIIDQWPFGEVGEKVLAALDAYTKIALLKKGSQ